MLHVPFHPPSSQMDPVPIRVNSASALDRGSRVPTKAKNSDVLLAYITSSDVIVQFLECCEMLQIIPTLGSPAA